MTTDRKEEFTKTYIKSPFQSQDQILILALGPPEGRGSVDLLPEWGKARHCNERQLPKNLLVTEPDRSLT